MSTVNRNLRSKFSKLARFAGAALLAVGAAPGALAQNSNSIVESAADRATYVDLVTLAERSELVIRVEIRRQTQLKPERAPGLEPGFARLYIEADTQALIAGNTSIGESLVYLVDVPLTAKGKAPKLKKRPMILFANTVPGRPATQRGTEIQLTAKNAQLDYSPAFEARLRRVLTSLAGADVPPKIDGIADALAVPGTLAGESETQIFLRTADQSPVSITVLRRPGLRPVWGVSWGEIVDSAARAPAENTLRWYRLACSLPRELPSNANLARDSSARRLAANDYRFVVDGLGECTRAITEAE
ncbi:hypothetical protein [Erythrobacter sp. F6033]|uniref:hypothetical protein n=1 Tax=Erythrobacter sp. F6033 TaxID=2926401 RepID=UPI001FF1EB48|nr:hypothetical protein [Erythrobacter sp. F6033]MCK0127041.1 hypothetical protein [Erythrobacter sp. F6033]